ncbi:hypothetical protein DFQ00_10469 [Paenibacillus barcinonensis]|uniref:Uncharacterized protein n=1 Tax=Paenibacillus barcinonensis TaxID=198119 RepID=A0A2V4VT60_PAEBA|nr:hypothetical protein DFQ00_10469 [Paenibacillus barcinonensis]
MSPKSLFLSGEKGKSLSCLGRPVTTSRFLSGGIHA